MGEIDKAKRMIQLLVRCSDQETEEAASKVCQDKEALALLTAAYGAATSMTAYAGEGAIATGVTGAGLPASIGLSAVAVGSGVAAKRFCQALVRHGSEVPLRQIMKDVFRSDMDSSSLLTSAGSTCGGKRG